MKTLFHTIFTVALLFFVTGCSSVYQATPEEVAALDKIARDQHFEIQAMWAQPMASQSLNSIANAGLLPPGSTASRIDIAGSRGYLRMVGDSVMADLPYFGERRMGGTYNPQQTGIKFEGVPKDFSLEPVTKGKGYVIKFNVNQGAEAYQVVAQLFPNRTARIAMSSSHRTNIWYQGNLAPYERKE
ncbi:DUF4251 domain-containing protein [Flagellimonas sediminis]|uniref:DUF4251 domain-containing protein n=1 Tax=Flagellimonas sediminis TaxID=2696468 RepID=A0A6I5KPY2_9FLAO|nr:DUF4251 domain-containing protein [Allomuricauda sediminis]NDV42954.1 DUF4251 domain-containing protein [Allomuricauda sediminis]